MKTASDNAKVALVTGASSGMGKVIAQQLIKDALTVVVAARRVDKMGDLEKRGAHVIAMDITNGDSVVAAVEEITKSFGGVDILVNNAGFGCYGTVEETAIDDARYQFEVNMFGLARLTQLLIPYMREKKSGKIINISSMGGKIYTPLGAWYHASKHALEGWSDCLRLELSAFGIDVVIVEPGIIETDFGDVLLDAMRERSGSGPYASLAMSVAKATANSYKDGGGSSPQVIADVVSAAAKARKPKTRYVAGKFAKPLLFVRKWFGDRVFDKLIMGTVK